MRKLIPVALALSLLASPFPGQGDEKAPPGEAEVARLIRQLGDDDFSRREAASKRLEELGAAVWEPLRRAADSATDAEVRIRSRDLVERLTQRLFGEVRRFGDGTQQINALAVSGDGKRLLSSAWDASLRLWDVESGKELARIADLKGTVWALALSRDGKQAYFNVGMDMRSGLTPATDFTIQVWDTEQDKIVRRLSGHTAEIKSIVLSPNGRTLISGGRDNTVRVWDLPGGTERFCLKGHVEVVRNLAFTPDGRRVLSASRDQTVRIWDVTTGKELGRFTGHTDDVAAVSVTPDGKQGVSIGADRVLRHWDLATAKEIQKLEGHVQVPWTVRVSPRGRLAVSGGGFTAKKEAGFYEGSGSDYDPRLWDLTSGKEIHKLEGTNGVTLSVVFAPDGKHVFTGSADGSIRMWRTDWPAR